MWAPRAVSGGNEEKGAGEGDGFPGSVGTLRWDPEGSELERKAGFVPEPKGFPLGSFIAVFCCNSDSESVALFCLKVGQGKEQPERPVVSWIHLLAPCRLFCFVVVVFFA